MTLYEEYITGWKDFESKILILENPTRIKNILMKINDRVEFRSKLTEINFGLFYAENSAKVDYEKNIGCKIERKGQI